MAVSHQNLHPWRRPEHSCPLGIRLGEQLGHAIFRVYPGYTESLHNDIMHLFPYYFLSPALHPSGLHYDNVRKITRMFLCQVKKGKGDTYQKHLEPGNPCPAN